ncbi:MAG: response regulator [Rhodospirillales bacterium]|nr:MAG: response regulator [Rhodospirillales bacterium]
MQNILVVEDEERVLKNVARSLTRAGFEVITAMTCESAWNVLKNSKIDAICLDIGLPDGSGLDLLERLRQIEPDIPAIVISGVTQPEAESRAARLGVKHFLPKPFSLANLRDALDSCLPAT